MFDVSGEVSRNGATYAAAFRPLGTLIDGFDTSRGALVGLPKFHKVSATRWWRYRGNESPDA